MEEAAAGALVFEYILEIENGARDEQIPGCGKGISGDKGIYRTNVAFADRSRVAARPSKEIRPSYIVCVVL